MCVFHVFLECPSSFKRFGALDAKESLQIEVPKTHTAKAPKHQKATPHYSTSLQPLELVTSAPDLAFKLWYATVKWQDLTCLSFHLLRVLFPGCLLLCGKQPKTSQYTLHNIDRDIHESRNVTTLFVPFRPFRAKIVAGSTGSGFPQDTQAIVVTLRARVEAESCITLNSLNPLKCRSTWQFTKQLSAEESRFRFLLEIIRAAHALMCSFLSCKGNIKHQGFPCLANQCLDLCANSIN